MCAVNMKRRHIKVSNHIVFNQLQIAAKFLDIHEAFPRSNLYWEAYKYLCIIPHLQPICQKYFMSGIKRMKKFNVLPNVREKNEKCLLTYITIELGYYYSTGNFPTSCTSFPRRNVDTNIASLWAVV